jgi:hypothetical protein
MMKSAENPLQFVATLYFFTLAPTGPLRNADHYLFVLLKYDLDHEKQSGQFLSLIVMSH